MLSLEKTKNEAMCSIKSDNLTFQRFYCDSVGPRRFIVFDVATFESWLFCCPVLSCEITIWPILHGFRVSFVLIFYPFNQCYAWIAN